MLLLLANRGNPDHGDNPERVAPGCPADETVEVKDFAAASAACRRYIDAINIGSGEWAGGQITNDAGEAIARVSFNGRVWAPAGGLLHPAEA